MNAASILNFVNYNAYFIASIMPAGSAIFLPAMSNAVPCPGEVLIISSPIVILTVLSAATVFIGINP